MEAVRFGPLMILFVRVTVLPFLIVLGLLLVALVLPSKRDTSVRAWWTRVCYQLNFFARAALALAVAAAIIWFFVLPVVGRSMGWR